MNKSSVPVNDKTSTVGKDPRGSIPIRSKYKTSVNRINAIKENHSKRGAGPPDPG